MTIKNSTARPIRTNRTEYEAGYWTRVNGLPIPGTASRAWARGYQEAWRKIATGEIEGKAETCD